MGVQDGQNGNIVTPRLSDVPPEERSFITRLEDLIRLPEDLKCEYERWEGLRDYVHTIGGLRDTPDTVATNFILRTQYAVISNLYPRDPIAQIKPAEWIPPEESTDPATQELGLADGNPLNTYPPEWLNYVKAQEIIINKQQQAGNLKGVIRGMIQDTLTLPVSWMKMRWIEDYSRDPMGFLQETDENIAVARYRSLKRSYDDKQFTDEDSRFFEMHEYNRQIKDTLIDDLNETLVTNPAAPETDVLGNEIGPDPRLTEAGELSSDKLLDEEDIPQIPHYQGYIYEAIDAEDVRFDWNITRPEDIRFAWWIAQRVYMAASEVTDRWNLDPEDAQALRQSAQYFNRDGTPFNDGEAEGKANEDERDRYKDIESQTRGAFVAVWEFWDRRQGKVYRWVQGFGVLLDDFVPEGTPKRFFPFFSLQFNRVTGQFFGPSDCELLRPLQEELNMLRTHDREARKSSYPRYMTAKGLLSKSNKREMRTAAPYSVIEVEKSQDLASSIHELIPARYSPELYDGSKARQDFEAMSGTSQAALGITGGAELATEAAIANQQTGIQSSSRKDIVIELLQDIYEAQAQTNAQRLGSENAKELAGPGTNWLADALERNQILNNFNIMIKAIPNGVAERQAEMKTWLDFTTIVSQLQLPLNAIQTLIELLRLMGLNTNIDQFVDLNALLGPPPEQQQQPGGNAGAPAGGRPDQQASEGAGGGRPANQEGDAPPGPESIPNAPQI